LKLLSAGFVTSAAAGDRVPDDGIPRIALAGRSNVGKSSLINALCRAKIARTSAAPGKTRLVNVYRVVLEGGPGGPGQWSVYLVDLPGYGYARGGDVASAELRTVAESYFRGERLRPERGATSLRQGYGGPPKLQQRRKPPSAGERAGVPGAPLLRAGVEGWGPASAKQSGPSDRTVRPRACALLLVDSRHPSLDSDRAAARWLDDLGIAYEVIATKIDKLSRAERARNMKTLEDTFEQAALPVSAVSGEGLDDLWKTIAKTRRNR
jgi:GTP-binding protein EngB required for normal cell division